MLESPPAFLLPVTDALANLTGWFDWGALEAIGTVGALWFIVVQTTRSARSDRAARIGTLTALIGLAEPIANAVPIFDGRNDGLLDRGELEFLAGARAIVQRGIDGIKLIPLPEVSAVGATEHVGALSLTLEHILQYLPNTVYDKISSDTLNSTSSYVYEAVNFFIKQRDYIEYGALLSHARNALRAVEVMLLNWRIREHRRVRMRTPMTTATAAEPAATAVRPENSPPPQSGPTTEGTA